MNRRERRAMVKEYDKNRMLYIIKHMSKLREIIEQRAETMLELSGLDYYVDEEGNFVSEDNQQIVNAIVETQTTRTMREFDQYKGDYKKIKI